MHSAESVSSNVSSRAFTCKIITIITITPIIGTTKKEIFGQFSKKRNIGHFSKKEIYGQFSKKRNIWAMCLILTQIITIITIIKKITIISIISILLASEQIQKDPYLIVID